MFSPGNASLYKILCGHISYLNSSAAAVLNDLASITYRNAAAVNAMEFTMSSGNIASGTIRIYGLSH